VTEIEATIDDDGVRPARAAHTLALGELERTL